MIPFSHTRLTPILIGLFFVVVVGYGYYEARGILYGPHIEVPGGVVTSHEQFVKVEGRATHIASIRMNGKQIPVTETGLFSEPFLLAPGSNEISLEAKDKYGHTVKETVRILYIPEHSIATSTPVRATNTSEVPTTNETVTPAEESATSTPATNSGTGVY